MLGAVVCATLAALASCSKNEGLSFEAPFTELNSAGERMVSKTWRASGSTAVHNNFVRLTPDRQSKKGAIWSTKSVGASELSAVLKFRISGQGKKYFGDGMALWLTDVRNYRAGDFHGSTENFKGIGIIIDTFKNAEMLTYHKDVTVVINTGENDIESMLMASIGCNGDVRYHEDRGDFSVRSASRVKFVVHSGDEAGSKLYLQVWLDQSNSGDYRECVAAYELPEMLDINWLSRAYMGVTSSTGQLADNHDVLELEVFSDKEVHVESEKMDESALYFPRGEGVSPERFERIEGQLDTLVGALEHLQHHLEHEMVAVDDHVRSTIDKLSKQEDISAGRIDDLEKKVVANVEDSLSERISTLEAAMRDAVQTRIKSVETQYMAKLAETVNAKVGNAGRGWTMPFLFLIGIDVAAAVAVYKWYLKFKKSHLL